MNALKLFHFFPLFLLWDLSSAQQSNLNLKKKHLKSFMTVITGVKTLTDTITVNVKRDRGDHISQIK